MTLFELKPRNAPFALLAALLFISPSGCAALSMPLQQSLGASAEREKISERILELQGDLIEGEVTGSNVVLLVKNGETIYHEVVNSGKLGDRKIQEDTLFPIWSMSKPITIVAMMTLHEKGLFAWDDPVSKYLPCFKNLMVREGREIRPAKEVLRIEHLMAHRSGYTYY
ncbi:MAG TPA: serine hydrolase domain-containing protein, partial [Planctomycetota bacterium]|nr:serine hydrolase domain-containing protein [Planctomycetota bacterium]